MIKSILTLFAKGFAMGSADLVPGISGATIALVLNVYQPFILNLKKVLSVESLKLLLTFRWREWGRYVHLEFLLPLVIGIFTCIFTLASLIAFLLDEHPIPFWSFFFGLIFCSALVLPDLSDGVSPSKIILAVVGILSGYLLISLNTLNTPDTSAMIFLAGTISIGAMLLPGISGSFMLVLIGKYALLIHAIKNLDFTVLSIFSLGAIFSLFLLPRVIGYLFKNNRSKNGFIIFVAGFLIGSLKKIWPWRLTEPVTQQEVVVSPNYYQNVLQQESQLFFAILFCLLGISLILLIRSLEKRFSSANSIIGVSEN